MEVEPLIACAHRGQWVLFSVRPGPTPGRWKPRQSRLGSNRLPHLPYDVEQDARRSRISRLNTFLIARLGTTLGTKLGETARNSCDTVQAVGSATLIYLAFLPHANCTKRPAPSS